jgi:hypothetical protein
MQVRFKTVRDPKNPEGLLVTYETVGGLVQDARSLPVSFQSQFELDSAFMAAGIYLRDVSHPGPERSEPPDPEKSFEVSRDNLRKIGVRPPEDERRATKRINCPTIAPRCPYEVGTRDPIPLYFSESYQPHRRVPDHRTVI